MIHLRKRTKFSNGYKDIEQVKFFGIDTTEKFVDTWSGMEGHLDTGIIDDVKLLFHSDYHAIFFDFVNDENLTTSPQNVAGRTSFCYGAYHIRDLPKKKIKTIELLTCNNGLIDAIDTQHLLADGVSKTKGNVAQAFLESQDVERINAYDGSLSYIPKTGYKRLALNQRGFYNYLEDLKDIRNIKPLRTYNHLYEPRGLLPKANPFGPVTYRKDEDGNMSVKYGSRITWRKIGDYDE